MVCHDGNRKARVVMLLLFSHVRLEPQARRFAPFDGADHPLGGLVSSTPPCLGAPCLVRISNALLKRGEPGCMPRLLSFSDVFQRVTARSRVQSAVLRPSKRRIKRTVLHE